MKHSIGAVALLGLTMVSSSPVGAQDLPRHLVGFQRSLDAGKVHMTFTTDLPIQSVVYFASRPDRLIVEFPDTDYAPTFTAAGGRGRGLMFCHWHRLGVSRLQCELGLPCRLPITAVHLRPQSAQLDLDIDLSYAMQDNYTVTSGIDWMQQQIVSEGRYLLWNQLSFSESDSNVHLAVGLAKERTDSREKPTAMGARMGAIGGVNGGFFATEGGPLGLVMRDKQLVAPHSDRRPPRTALEVRQDGSVAFERLAWRKDHVETADGETRSDLVLALGAGPRLVSDGKVALTTDLEELGPKGNDITRIAARTAVGVTRNKRVQVVVATGYHDIHTQGLNLDELATLMVSQGATQAMNLDGGSSTSMFVGNQVVSNGVGAPPLEKTVGTALLVVDHRPQLFPSGLRLSLSGTQMAGDGKSSLQLTVSASTPDGRPVPDGTPVRAYPNGVWLDTQLQTTRAGLARFAVQSLTRVGLASVRVESGAAVASSELRLVPTEAAELWTRLTINNPGEAPLSGEQLVFVTCQVNDHYGNPVPNVNVTMTGAPAGDLSSLTGANGVASLPARMPQVGGFLEVRAVGLPPRRLQVPAIVPAPAPTPTPAPGGDPTPSPVRPYLR